MVGAARYARSPLDYYPTEERCTKAFLEVFGDDVAAMQVWEPFCGDGGISVPLKDHVRALVSTDIAAYEGFDPDALFDFMRFVPTPTDGMTITLEQAGRILAGEPALTLDDLEALGLPRPDAIISNTPYDDKVKGIKAADFIRHAIKIMEPERGFCAFLLRNEWDCARKHKDLTDHPAYRGKVVLRFRPRWIKGSKGSPRHNYSWFCWDWVKAAQAPGIRPEIFYAG